tara:strand:- start:1341 stop:1457 length:117 start_codon:yes stop_codon:yes gene_type:complete
MNKTYSEQLQEELEPLPEEEYKNKEGTDWDYDTYGHGG